MKKIDNDGLVYDENLTDMVPNDNSNEDKIENVENLNDDASDGGGIIQKSLEDVFHMSMMPYTEHVVLERALPRVEDGLKPVQRRILYTMFEQGLHPDKPYRKSAKVVGECMANYHPHGDSSIYDAMVRMSQNFSLNQPLIDGHGNFGSIDGDSPAAMRYTEARMTPLTLELLRDIEKDTIKWVLNFDDRLKEPEMLPGRFPNLLVNGASGIAVGVATNIPPHNLGEVIDGVIAYIDNPNIQVEELMQYIVAPDFPTGGQLILGDGAKQAYLTGKGKITIRAKVSIEKSGDKNALVITELPYQVNKSALLQKIAELKEQNKDKLACISEIRDESDRKGMRAVIRLKKEANPKSVLEFLFKSTSLQTSFALNMVAIAQGKPKLLNLVDMISYYTEYQREVIVRRSNFELTKARERVHIVQGLLIAIKNIDNVIRIIKSSLSVQDAKNNLKKEYNISNEQAQAILDMRLARLVNLEISKLEDELKELNKIIDTCEKIINSKAVQYKIIKKDLLEIRKLYATPRKCEILENAEIKIKQVKEEPIASYSYTLAITAENMIKKATSKNYSMSKKNIDENTTTFDISTDIIEAKSNDIILIFTNMGNCLKLHIDKIKEVKWRDKGVLLQSLDVNVAEGEKPVKLLVLGKEEVILFYTKQGMVKKSKTNDNVISKTYFQALKLNENDQVLNIEFEKEDKPVLIITKFGLSLCFAKDEIPVQGRLSAGVKGINLEENDQVIFAQQISAEEDAVIATNAGCVKKFKSSIFSLSQRYRKGLRCLSFTGKSKELVFAKTTTNSSILIVDFGVKILPFDTKKLNFEERLEAGSDLIKRKFINIYNTL